MPKNIIKAFLIFILSSCNNHEWHNEKYIVEGSAHYLTGKIGIPAVNKYYVAGEEITLEARPQTRIVDQYKINSYKTSGPYKLTVFFDNAGCQEKKKIIIHSISLESSLNVSHVLQPIESFPIMIDPSDSYPVWDCETQSTKSETFYEYKFSNPINLNFGENEVLYIKFDIEVIKNANAKRDMITLKLRPLLDEGSNFQWPT